MQKRAVQRIIFRAAAVLFAMLLVEVSYSQTIETTVHDYEDGTAFKAECDNVNSPFFLGECEGYIEAIAGVMLENNSINGFRACIPEGVTVARLKDVVYLYLTVHSVKLHLAASGLVAEALEDAFPCR